MIDWMVRNSISRETNMIFKIYKILKSGHILENCAQVWLYCGDMKIGV